MIYNEEVSNADIKRDEEGEDKQEEEISDAALRWLIDPLECMRTIYKHRPLQMERQL